VSKTTVADYDFSEDAMGLGDFISENMGILPDQECVVYVRDHDGNHATRAAFVRETLTDGSTVVNLVITFDA
jgi:hypothetical protein